MFNIYAVKFNMTKNFEILCGHVSIDNQLTEDRGATRMRAGHLESTAIYPNPTVAYACMV